ncbi:MAG: hypothetical protein H5T69_12135, partial [Chloroflexi bacterium]|nr:hypothetical protein [Chloroflexota bacterium]
MSNENNGIIASEQQLYWEILNLRGNMLSSFIRATVALTWLWYGYQLVREWQFLVSTSIAVLVMFLLWTASRARGRWLTMGAILLYLAVMALETTLVYSQPEPITLAFGTLAVFIVGAFLRPGATFAMAMASWAAAMASWYATTGQMPSPGLGASILLLYHLAWAIGFLAAGPLSASVQWALAGWARAREVLEEVQARRAELYRALRALEEATFRIEQMNRELITARREAENARAQKARFAATVSHELRGPLNLILGFSRLMALMPESYGTPLPEPYWADVDTIYRSSQHLATLIDDVLDLSQIEAERLPLVKDRVDLNEDIVNKALEIVKPLAERKGLYLRGELANDLPWIMADSVRLRQALLNLLTNAVRFTEQGGVTVRTGQADGVLTVSVIDTGKGIPAEDIPKLFCEFSQ